MRDKITLGLSNTLKTKPCPWCRVFLGKLEHTGFTSLFFGTRAVQLCHKASESGKENSFYLFRYFQRLLDFFFLHMSQLKKHMC